MQMPENIPTMDWVLVITDKEPYVISIARYDGDKWDFLCTNDSWTYGAAYGDTTIPIDLDQIGYWMPLPKSPEGL